MIISKFTYDCMLDLITEQQKVIEEYKKENSRLAHDNIKFKSELFKVKRDLKDLQNFCINYAADNHNFIDFPNSHTKGGNTANTGTDDINDILNL